MDQCIKKDEGVSSVKYPSSSRTILWCVPRSGSTALTKCLSAIDGIETWFEPFVFCLAARVEYRLDKGGDLPAVYEGNEEAYAQAKQLVDFVTRSNSVPERLAYATAQRRMEASSSRYVLLKDLSYAVTDGRLQFIPRGYKHTFLIRNPLRYIHSWRKSMFRFMSPLGVLRGAAAEESTFDLERDDRYWPSGCHMKETYDLWKYVKETIDSDPAVIDAEDLLTKPKETLSRYCALVGLPYHDGLLQWKGSVEGFHNVRACSDDLLEKNTSFYGTAIKSTGFLPPSECPPRDQLTPDVIRCSERVMKYFNEMYDSRLKV